MRTRATKFDQFLLFGLRHRLLGLLTSVVVALAGAFVGRTLPIRLSIIDLLPADKPIVRDLREVEEEVGGVGYLGVLVGPTDEPEQYVERVARALERRNDIRYAFYERETYALRDKALYLLPREAFDRLIESAWILLLDGRTGAIDLDLEGEEERVEHVAEARQVLESSSPVGERYFRARDERSAVVFAKPTFDSADLGSSTLLIREAHDELVRAIPAGVPIRFFGRYVNQVNDTTQITSDITLTSLISMTLIGVLLFLGIGTLRGAFITVGCVMLSMGWTAGFAWLAVGQINIVTGFMLAILGGLGVEYGVHLLRRHRQEQVLGATDEDAIRIAYLKTGRSLLSAALTSAGAFFILSFSDFRGFSELGLIAGFGILSIYLVFILSFPAFAHYLGRHAGTLRTTERFAIYPFTTRWNWVTPIVAALLLYGIASAELEVDFKRMRRLSLETQQLERRVNEMMNGRSTSPAAILATSRGEATNIRDVLRRLNHPAIEYVVSLSSLLPDDQEERYRELEELRRKVSKVSDDDIQSKVGIDPAEVRAWLNQKPYEREQLPRFISDAFGRSGNVVLVYSNANLDIVPGMKSFDGAFDVVRAQFPNAKIGSDVPILLAIVEHVFGDGRLILVLFLAGAFLVLWMDFRSVKDALWLEAQLVLGTLFLIGAMGLVGRPFTILNVAMIPAVLSAGIDMGVHVRHRERENGGRALDGARFVAQAVHIGALTAIAGFGSLFFAEAEMLRGIAWVAVLGQISMYIVCMFVFPLMREQSKLWVQHHEQNTVISKTP